MAADVSGRVVGGDVLVVFGASLNFGKGCC